MWHNGAGARGGFGDAAAVSRMCSLRRGFPGRSKGPPFGATPGVLAGVVVAQPWPCHQFRALDSRKARVSFMNEREDMPSYGQNLRAILLILLVNVALVDCVLRIERVDN